MDTKSIKKIIKKIMLDDGFKDYTITSLTHPVGTNIWTILIISGEWEIILQIDDDSGNLMDKKKTRHLVRTINERMTIADTVNASLGIYFELTEQIAIPGNFKNTHDIQLEFDPEKKNMLNAFMIKTKTVEHRDIVDALHKAFHLTNYLTFKTGLFVFHKQPRRVINGKIESKSLTGGLSAVLTRLVDLDLTDPSLYNLISVDSKENQQLAHFASGQRAIGDENYSEAIREFFLVIEHSDIPDEDKYRPLRHAVSHEKLDDPKTVTSLFNSFGISMSVGSFLSITDPIIQDVLRREAKSLREITITYLNDKMKI